jgi:hypothetical protein
VSCGKGAEMAENEREERYPGAGETRRLSPGAREEMASLLREPVANEPAFGASLLTAIRLAGGELPDGFNVHIRIERGAFWVSLDYPGAPFAYEPKDASAMTMSEQILDCIEKAKTTPIVHVR